MTQLREPSLNAPTSASSRFAPPNRGHQMAGQSGGPATGFPPNAQIELFGAQSLDGIEEGRSSCGIVAKGDPDQC